MLFLKNVLDWCVELWLLFFAGICREDGGQVTCAADDVTVECGPVVDDFRRRKRSSTSGSAQLNIKFKVKMAPSSRLETACISQCEETAALVLFDECYAACSARAEEDRRGVMRRVSTQIEAVLNQGQVTVSRPQESSAFERISSYSRDSRQGMARESSRVSCS